MDPRSALVTGATGFVGRYMVEELLRQGWTVWALSRADDVPRHGARPIRGDLNDLGEVERALERCRPDAVIHLAAQSSVPQSFADPVSTLRNNLMGAAHLLYSAARLQPMPRVLAIGSAEEYGQVPPEDLPISERQPVAPVSPYGVSKAAQSLLSLSLHRGRGLPVVVIRPFNHTGPGQQPRFAVPSFASQIARIEAGLQEPVIRVGNLDARRDFLDVRDVVLAYALAIDAAEPGEVYNLGAGEATPIRWILDELLRRTPARVRVKADPSRPQPASISESCADSSKFRETTGWQPRFTLEQTLQDVLDYWREQVRQERASPANRSEHR